MEQLLEDSLLLNTLGASPLNFKCVAIRFAGFLAETLRAIEGISVAVEQSHGLSDAIIYSNGALLKRAFIIIIRLAACFSSPKNRISLTVTLKNDVITIEIPLNSFMLTEAQAHDFFELTANVRGQSHAQDLGLAPVVAERIIALLKGSLRILKTTEKNGVILLTLAVKI
jgi:K+-sensing histidine kinase KdpD